MTPTPPPGPQGQRPVSSRDREQPARSRRAPSPGISGLHWYIRLAAVFAMVLVIGIAAGVLIERNIIANPATAPSQFANLDAVANIIEENYYYRPTDPTEESTWTVGLEQQAINGMLGSLDDTYTRYLPPADAEAAANQLAGKYEGIGITIGTENEHLVITGLLQGGPAEQAGLLAGDVLTAVDGRPVVAGDDVSSMIKGPAGSQVELKIQRPGASEPISITVTRQEIVTPPVTYAMIPNTSIALIRISIFGDQTTPLATRFLQQATADGATGVILDLRGNGGGWVTSAQEVIGRFVQSAQGPALYEDTTSAPGGEVGLPIVNGEAPLYTGPLVVLVDGNTASAAEIVAGSLKDYDRALIVGRKTFGKGSVQRIYDFKDGASMRVTIAEWLTPSKGRIQDVGIAPNIPVSIDEHTSTGQDADLAHAVALLNAGQSRPTDLAKGPAATPVPVASPGATPGASPAP